MGNGEGRENELENSVCETMNFSAFVGPDSGLGYVCMQGLESGLLRAVVDMHTAYWHALGAVQKYSLYAHVGFA